MALAIESSGQFLQLYLDFVWPLKFKANDDFKPQPPDLQNILRQSYDYLTIMPNLGLTYDRRLIHKTGFSRVQFTCKIVKSSEIGPIVFVH